MGEYIKLNGKEIKLGTCENLYYVRLDDLKNGKGEKEDGNLSLSGYLDPKNGFRYRFPFPEEDGTQPGSYEPYEKGLLIFLSEESPELLKDLPTWEHYNIYNSCSYNGVINVNIISYCPLSSHPPIMGGTPAQAVVLLQQKQVEGEIWVVVGCPYCGARVRLSRDEALELSRAASNMGRGNDPSNLKYWHEVSYRIMAGYKIPELV